MRGLYIEGLCRTLSAELCEVDVHVHLDYVRDCSWRRSGVSDLLTKKPLVHEIEGFEINTVRKRTHSGIA